MWWIIMLVVTSEYIIFCNIEYNFHSVASIFLPSRQAPFILSFVFDWFSCLNLRRLSSANQKVIESEQI